MGRLHAVERPAAARFGWCAAVALAAHGVVALAGWTLARTHAPANTPLTLMSVDLEEPAPRMGDTAQPRAIESLGAASKSERLPATVIHRGARRSVRAPAVATKRALPSAPVEESPAALFAGAAGVAPAGDADGEHSTAARGERRGSGSANVFRGGAAAAHGPRLLAAKPCQGMFPASANDDMGVVTLALQVGQEGVARRARILDERPRGQGFARAALSCVPRLTFDPATRDDGTRTAATSTVRLRFVRHL